MTAKTTNSDLLFFNGVNGATGDYGLPPMSGEELAGFIRGERPPENLNELRFRYQQQSQTHFGVKEGVDPKRLDEAGWGLILPHDADPAIKEALSPLLKLRREQAGEKFRLYEGEAGYRPGESKDKFLARHGAGPGPADPDRVPYYLLIAGSPALIPARFQSQLDVQYAVGRISFDTIEAYAHYARSVVAAETGQVKLPRQVSLFGVANPDDKATRSSVQHLIQPLFERLKASQPTWQVEAYLEDRATKSHLTRLLGGNRTPALLFTASHGMEFPLADPLQLPHQGALLCQDWPGPRAWRGKGPIPQDFYFAGDDLADDAGLLGLISFHFACYSGGTPQEDEFAKQAFKKARRAIATQPFLAALPTRLLSHPRGGALAAIAHIERAWGYSFLWQGAGPQTVVFESTLARLLDGHPIGSAIEFFNERYAELATLLSDELEEMEFGKQVDPYQLAGMWTANNDARGYIILGDPAVRLPVAQKDEVPAARPVLELEPVLPSPSPPPIRVEPIAAPSGPVDQPLPVSFDLAVETGAEVHFSAFHPRAIPPGEWCKLLVYAHLLTALDEVKLDAGQILGKSLKEYRQGKAAASKAIAPGTVITLLPQAEGLEFDPPQASLTWSDEWQRADFQMRATGQRVGHVIEGSIACYIGPLLIADIRLPVVVPKPGEAVEAAETSQSAKLYQAIFASYSHADAALVEAVETAYKALGMDYLRDVMTLKSGQTWSDQLLHMIEQADIFQLFWSTSSSQSPYVEQEWQYALNLAEKKGSAFIRPVYWQKPMPPVPTALSHLHFAPIDFGGLDAPAAKAESPIKAVAAAPTAKPVATASVTIKELKTLIVSTYSGDPAKPDTASLKAQTRISLEGEVAQYLPAELGDGDEAYLEMHHALVKQALKARLSYLKLILKE